MIISYQMAGIPDYHDIIACLDEEQNSLQCKVPHILL